MRFHNRIIQWCLALVMVTMCIWANEQDEVLQNNIEEVQNSQESPLIKGIRAADTDFYQGVVLWVKNIDDASTFLKKACDARHPGACLYLGNYYEAKSQNKRDLQHNLTESAHYYKLGYDNSLEACKEGAIEWCAIQAVALIDGRGVEKDVAKGLEYLEIMCERDIQSACSMLGSYYFYGVNVQKDLDKAKEFNQKALELNSKACDEHRMYACVLSAEIYQQGLSVPQDLSKAKNYYHRACDLHNQFACDYVQKLK